MHIPGSNQAESASEFFTGKKACPSECCRRRASLIWDLSDLAHRPGVSLSKKEVCYAASRKWACWHGRYVTSLYWLSTHSSCTRIVARQPTPIMINYLQLVQVTIQYVVKHSSLWNMEFYFHVGQKPESLHHVHLRENLNRFSAVIGSSQISLPLLL